ncbi:MAG: penicillin-binding protein, partial [Prevotella bivia]|nr:penicillin-binding protein [Prevotella bivia]
MNIIKKWATSLKLFAIALGLSFSSTSTNAQEFILEAPTTLHPSLQELGTELMKNKTGSIVAINPANGEIICMVTNSPL